MSILQHRVNGITVLTSAETWSKGKRPPLPLRQRMIVGTIGLLPRLPTFDSPFELDDNEGNQSSGHIKFPTQEPLTGMVCPLVLIHIEESNGAETGLLKEPEFSSAGPVTVPGEFGPRWVVFDETPGRRFHSRNKNWEFRFDGIARLAEDMPASFQEGEVVMLGDGDTLDKLGVIVDIDGRDGFYVTLGAECDRNNAFKQQLTAHCM